jgi:hypothetical protein
MNIQTFSMKLLQNSAKVVRNYARVINYVKVGAQRHRKMTLAYFLEAFNYAEVLEN